MVLATPNVALPQPAGLFPEPERTQYFESLVQRIATELNARTRDDAASPNLLLQSPGGAVWSIFVDDAGKVSATKVRG